jgi:transcriptional regulator with XRE-family HTH domain
MENLQSTARRLREERRKKDLTLAQLSAKTGVPISTLAAYENGKITATFEKLLQISTALGVDLTQSNAQILHETVNYTEPAPRVIPLRDGHLAALLPAWAAHAGLDEASFVAEVLRRYGRAASGEIRAELDEVKGLSGATPAVERGKGGGLVMSATTPREEGQVLKAAEAVNDPVQG